MPLVELYGPITLRMDDFLSPALQQFLKENPQAKGTYLLKEPLVDSEFDYVIRFPGATRGSISVNREGIIQDIEFLQETCFSARLGIYGPEMAKAIREEFIGIKLIAEPRKMQPNRD